MKLDYISEKEHLFKNPVHFLMFLQAGQAYFISDCKPVNNFVFFRPLVIPYFCFCYLIVLYLLFFSISNISYYFRPMLQIEGLGYKYPNLSLPITLIYLIGKDLI